MDHRVLCLERKGRPGRVDCTVIIRGQRNQPTQIYYDEGGRGDGDGDDLLWPSHALVPDSPYREHESRQGATLTSIDQRLYRHRDRVDAPTSFNFCEDWVEGGGRWISGTLTRTCISTHPHPGPDRSRDPSRDGLNTFISFVG